MITATRSRAARSRAAAGALVLVLLAACGSAPETTPAEELTPASEVGLSASVLQYRSDIARRVLTVRVQADTALEVRGLALRPAGFEELPAAPTDAVLGGGNSVDLPAGYGAAVCDTAPAGASDAVVDVRQGDRDVRVRLDLEDPYDLFAGLHEAECTERTIRAQVEFSFVGGWQPDATGALLRSTLRVRRLAGTAEVLVDEVQGNVIFAVRAGPVAGPVGLLAPDAAEVSVPFELEAVRCDPHALAESKRSTAFGLFVAVDGGVLVPIVVDPAEEERGTIVQFATDSCAGRTS